MQIKITKPKPVKEAVLNEREARFVRNVLGGISTSAINLSFAEFGDSFNFTEKEIRELHLDLYKVLNENFK